MVSEDAGVLEELGSSTCHEVTSHGVGMGLVAGAEEQAQTLALAIREVELAGSVGEVDERHVLLCRYDTHRLHITHREVGSRNALVLLEFTVLDLSELITEVVLAFAGDVIAAEISTADRAHEHRIHA